MIFVEVKLDNIWVQCIDSKKIYGRRKHFFRPKKNFLWYHITSGIFINTIVIWFSIQFKNIKYSAFDLISLVIICIIEALSALADVDYEKPYVLASDIHNENKNPKCVDLEKICHWNPEENDHRWFYGGNGAIISNMIPTFLLSAVLFLNVFDYIIIVL